MEYSFAGHRVTWTLKGDQLDMLRPQYRASGTALVIDASVIAAWYAANSSDMCPVTDTSHNAADYAAALTTLGKWFRAHARGRYPSIPEDKHMARFLKQIGKLSLSRYILLVAIVAMMMEDDSILATYVAEELKAMRARSSRLDGWVGQW